MYLGLLSCQLAQGLFIGSAGNSFFGDDRGYVFRRGYVECGIFDSDPIGNHLFSADVGYLFGVALLDGNLAAIGTSQVHGRNGRGYVERDAVLFGENRDRVSADLVGDVAVGRDAVGADYDGSDLPFAHHRARHVVGDDGGGDAVFHQFPRGQARALQKGPRLVGVNVNLLALLDGRADHSERCAVSRGSERSGVAVGEHSAAARHERRAVASHGLIRGNVFGVHTLRFFNERLLDLRDRADANALELFLHAADGPEQIHRSGARLSDEVADLIEIAFQVAVRFGFGIVYAERNAHGSRDADRRRPAHHHVADDVGYLLVCLAGDVGFFGRQLRLVDEAYAAVGPFKSLNHRKIVRCSSLVVGSDSNLVRVTQGSGIVGHCRPSTNFANRSDRENIRLRVVGLQDVLLTHVVGGEYRNERRRGCGFLHIRAALMFFALHQAHHADDLESEFARGLDRLDRGSAGRADIVDNHDPGAFLVKAFDALSGAMLLFGLAHQESVKFSADHGDGDHNWVCPHRQPADGPRLPSLFLDFLEDHFSSQARAFRVERRGAAVNVIVAGRA